MPGVIAVFVLGALVGLLIAWYPSRQQAHVHLRECDSLRDALNDHRRRLEQQAAEKDELQTQLLTQEQKIRDLTAQSEWRKVTIDQLKDAVSEREGQLKSAGSNFAEMAAPEKQPDNLKRIEGIGPKISQLLQDAGILTFGQLADTDVSRLQEILEAADLAALANPSTWPDQARLAAEGNWTALASLQDELKGGRRA